MHGWMDGAACRGHDPELFFPAAMDAYSAQRAVNICGKCPVVDVCHSYREKVGATSGVWHGHWYKPSAQGPNAMRRDGLMMAANGMTEGEIAEELDVPEVTVRRWIWAEVRRLSRPNARKLSRESGGLND